MPMQDVSNDQTMISWLRQTGHAHLLDEQLRNNNNNNNDITHNPRSSSPPPIQTQDLLHGLTNSSSNYPIQNTSLPSPLPPPHFISNDPLINSGHQLGSFHPTNFGGPIGSPSSPIIPPFNASSSPLHFDGSPTQFLTPNYNQQQIDMDIENMKRDPNTRIVNRPPQDDIVYKQRVFVRYLQPPTPPAGGTIIVREKQPPPPPPDPPIVIKRAPPPPPTPPPVIIRERPPPIPAAEGTTVIDKLVPPGPKPPRQLVIEQYPPLPPKPQNVIIERWLPIAPRQRRIIYERLPPSAQQAPRPIVVQYGPPHVRVQREVISAPGAQLPLQQLSGQTDINHILNQFSGSQNISSSFPVSSLGSYNPLSTIQPNYGVLGQSQPNIVIMQNPQANSLTSSSYGVPMSCVCTPNQSSGLGAYGSGLSMVPTIGQSAGQSTVFNIPDNIPIDNVLRQLGIDPNTLQRSGAFPSSDPSSAVSHVWNAAAHANPSHSLNPNSAVSHVWNAAAHAIDHNHPNSSSAVSHVWNAANQASDRGPYDTSAASNAWNRIEQYLHPQSNSPLRPSWNNNPNQGGPPPPNYPPPPSNYPPPPPSNYPPPPPSNYPPPPPSNYPPPHSSSYPPPGGPSNAASGVLSRLFGGGQ